MGSFCSTQLLAAGEQLSGQQEEVRQALEEVQDQTLHNQEELEQQRAELQQQLESSRQLVHGFLQEDLQQDVPTGTWTSESPPTHASRTTDPQSDAAFRGHAAAPGLCVSPPVSKTAEPR